MTLLGPPTWHAALDALLTQPPLRRAAKIMAIFSLAQFGATALSLWLVHESGQVDMSWFAPVVITGAVGVVVCAGVLWLLDRHDPPGDTRIGRFAMCTTAVLYGWFGVAIAYLFGFWASPFLLFPALVALLVGIVFNREAGVVSIVASVLATLALEALRFLDQLPYAPALLDDTVAGSGQLSRVVGTGGPLLAFVIITVVLGFGMLAVVEFQRDALHRTHDLIRRYVPTQVADAVLEHGDTTTRLRRRKITIFFSDIVGFTETTERMEPEDLEIVLGEYFSEMARIAAIYDGTIDELVGDAVLIFFGAPVATTDRDHALRAVRMAIDMREAVTRLNERWEAAGIDAIFQIRIGINTGVVAVGNVGSGLRQKYAAIGRSVNLASRIQSSAEPGEILMTRATWLLTRDEIASEPRDEVEFKGIGRPIELHAVSEAGDEPEGADKPAHEA